MNTTIPDLGFVRQTPVITFCRTVSRFSTARTWDAQFILIPEQLDATCATGLALITSHVRHGVPSDGCAMGERGDRVMQNLRCSRSTNGS